MMKIELLSITKNPEVVIWKAMHQCVSHESDDCKIEFWAKDKIERSLVINLLKQGHWSPFEHASMAVRVSGCSHRVVQQITRHRHLGFSVQSFRYTDHLMDLYKEIKSLEPNPWDDLNNLTFAANKKLRELFSYREPGIYQDRYGQKINYNPTKDDISYLMCLLIYGEKIEQGYPKEMAANFLPMGVNQNFVVSGNLRAWFGFFDKRSMKDAQLEIRQLSDSCFNLLSETLPVCCEWYKRNRLGKNKLAP